MTTTDTVSVHGPTGAQNRRGADGPNSHDAHKDGSSQRSPDAVGPNIDTGHGTVGDHRGRAGVEQSPTDPPTTAAKTNAVPPGPSASTPPGAPTRRSQATDATASPEAQTPPAPAMFVSAAITTAPVLAAHDIDPGQVEAAAHARCAGVEQYIRDDQVTFDAQRRYVLAEQGPSGQAVLVTTPTDRALVLTDPLLALSADVLDDLERVRVANENRLRQLTRTATDADGEDRGFGLDESHPDVARLAALVDALGKAEHTAELNLSRQMRAHALGPWVKTTTGVGEKQAARLLACIGDPYMRPELERDGEVEPSRPRLVSELWSYCGYGDARAQVRRRGVQANWDDTAKKRAWLISKSGVRSLRAPCHVPEGQSWAEHTDDCRCGPYRLVYDEARRKYDGTVHPEECKRCGPSGKPAVAGSLRSAGHQEAMALRAMSKALLRDLWREARRLHGVTDEEDPA